MRYIGLDFKASSVFHMALDAFLVDSQLDEPVLRIYRFPVPTVTLGVAQEPAVALDYDSVKKQNVEVCRRITGGKALLHDQGLTYSIIVPRASFSCDIRESYQVLSGPVYAALQKYSPHLRFKADGAYKERANSICFLEHEVETICLDGAKIVGSAQKRNRYNVLQHGEICLFPPVVDAVSLFQSELEREYLNKIYSTRVGTLFSEPQDDFSMDALADSIREEFEKLFGRSSEDPLQSTEFEQVLEKVKKLAIPGWTEIIEEQ